MAGEKSGEQDAPSIGLFDLVDGTFSVGDLDLMRSLPRRALPVIVHGLPAWLEGLADSDPVRVFEAGADRLETAGSVRAALLAIQHRQARKGLHHIEVARLLTDALARLGFARTVPAARIEQAFERGELVFFEETTDDLASPGAGLNLPMSLLHYGCYTTPEHVTAWLKSNPPPVPGLTACPPGPWSEALPCQQQHEAPEAAPVLAVAGSPGGADPASCPVSVRHNTAGTGRASDAMGYMIEQAAVALRLDLSLANAAALFAELQNMAERKPPTGCLIGLNDAGGIIWQSANGPEEVLTLAALRGRIRRRLAARERL
jgi:hypothetical protein